MGVMVPSPTPLDPTAKAARRSRSVALDPLLGGIVERFRGPLVALLQRRGVPGPADLAQDVFAELWLSRKRFVGDWEDDAVVGPWLVGIAKTLGAAEKRKSASGPQRLGGVPEGELPAANDTSDRDQRAAELRAAIDRLPEELGTAIVMHALERTPVKRIAALLGVTDKTIEGRLSRARKELARILAGMATEVR